MNLFEQNTHKPHTKTGKVLAHLQREGSITSWDAIQLYRATRLSAIIFNLKEEGYNISSVNKKDSNSHWVNYIYKGNWNYIEKLKQQEIEGKIHADIESDFPTNNMDKEWWNAVYVKMKSILSMDIMQTL